MLDVVYIATLIAFFAVMVLFVKWCERIVGKEDVVTVEPTDTDTGTGPDDDGPDDDGAAATTTKTPEEVAS